ncbi:MAG: hypothetical protein J6Y07_01635 [Alphaproteobacteria bacterium]|nr:hypothetical protein [Alphaproteobacteria bacterium]
MLTKVDLCSMALLKLGENPIQSLSEDTAAAKLGRTLVDFVIDTLLAMHPWRFACRTYNLIRDENGDFIIPSDILRIIKTNGKVMENKIISNADNLTITAVVRVTPNDFPSYFASLVATKLAVEFCMPLISDQTVFRTLVALYENELQTAKFIDSTTSVNTNIEDFSLINSRF